MTARAAQGLGGFMLYARPATCAVAAFVGEANFLEGHAEGPTVVCALGRLPLVVPHTGVVTVMVRPEALILEPDPDGVGRIERVVFFGYDQLVDLRLPDGTKLLARMRPQSSIAPERRVRVHVQGSVMAYAPPLNALCVNRNEVSYVSTAHYTGQVHR